MSQFFYRVRFVVDHRWAPGRMSDYLDGELASSRRTRMQRHVKECPECRQLLAILRRLLDELHRLPPPVSSVGAPQIAASVRLRLRE